MKVVSQDKKVTHVFESQRVLILEFLKLLAVTHECRPEMNVEKNLIQFQGPSPDEVTLVEFA